MDGAPLHGSKLRRHTRNQCKTNYKAQIVKQKLPVRSPKEAPHKQGHGAEKDGVDVGNPFEFRVFFDGIRSSYG